MRHVGEGGVEVPEAGFERGARIDVAGRAEPRGDLRKRHGLDAELAVDVAECGSMLRREARRGRRSVAARGEAVRLLRGPCGAHGFRSGSAGSAIPEGFGGLAPGAPVAVGGVAPGAGFSGPLMPQPATATAVSATIAVTKGVRRADRAAAVKARNIERHRSKETEPEPPSIDMLTDSEFITAADRTLAAIGDALDAALDVSDADIDWSLNDGILEIDCGGGGKVIVNRHVANREIWVAARSGGFHFRPRERRVAGHALRRRARCVTGGLLQSQAQPADHAAATRRTGRRLNEVSAGLSAARAMAWPRRDAPPTPAAPSSRRAHAARRHDPGTASRRAPRTAASG